MRSKNDGWVIESTLKAVLDQTMSNFDLVNIDSGSTDETLDVIKKYNKSGKILTIKPEEYIPGKVLNMGIENAAGDILVFINSDATPQNPDWMEKLVEPFKDKDVAATFGQQIPRPDCTILFRKDYERAFGDGRESAKWRHFFSMAISAIRRSVWEKRKFTSEINYSEDIEWTWQIKKMGYKVIYVPQAIAMHSHNYTFAQLLKRHQGEGRADAYIFREEKNDSGFIDMCLKSAVSEVVRDAVYCIKQGDFMGILRSPFHRAYQKFGYYKGFNEQKNKLVNR